MGLHWTAKHFQTPVKTLPTCKTGQTSKLGFWQVCLLACLALFTSHSAAEEFSWTPYKAIYIAKMNDNVVDEEGIRELKYLGNKRFQFSAVAEHLLFKLEENSEFQADGDKVIPIQYQSTRSTPFQKRKKASGFDWENKTYHYKDRKKSGTKKLKKGWQDPLSFVFEVARQIKSGATEIKLKEANGRKIKKRTYVVLGEETLEVPYGSIETIKVQKVDDDKETIMWMAPSLNYLTVKVQQKDKGEFYELSLKKYQPKKAVTFEKPKENVVPANSTQHPASQPIKIEEPPMTEADIK